MPTDHPVFEPTVDGNGAVYTPLPLAADDNTFTNDGRTFIAMKKLNDSIAVNIEFANQVVCNFGIDDDIPITITTQNDQRIYGPFNTKRFNDGSGKMHVVVTGGTAANVEIMCFRAPNQPKTTA